MWRARYLKTDDFISDMAGIDDSAGTQKPVADPQRDACDRNVNIRKKVWDTGTAGQRDKVGKGWKAFPVTSFTCARVGDEWETITNPYHSTRVP